MRMASFTPRPLYCRGKRPPFQLDRRLGWVPKPVWTRWKGVCVVYLNVLYSVHRKAEENHENLSPDGRYYGNTSVLLCCRNLCA